jgi:hypothetical protein
MLIFVILYEDFLSLSTLEYANFFLDWPFKVKMYVLSILKNAYICHFI